MFQIETFINKRISTKKKKKQKKKKKKKKKHKEYWFKLTKTKNKMMKNIVLVVVSLFKTNQARNCADNNRIGG